VDNNDVTSNPTQLQRNEVTHHVTTTPADLSALSNQRPAAPTQPSNHDDGPSHVADDVIALPANGALAASCSRSSSRSSGFDEISSAVTEWSLLPVSLAHAQHDRPQVTASNMADEDHNQADMSGEDGTRKNEDYDDRDSLDTLRISADNRNNDDNNNDRPIGDRTDELQASCSSQVAEEEAKQNDAERLEELSRQIESMSERFNKLFARVKASEGAELRRSTTSLNDCDTRGLNHHQSVNDSDTRSLNQQPRTILDDSRQKGPNTAVEVTKYSRNTAYRQWLGAKSGLGVGLESWRDINKTAGQQPIATAADDVAVATVGHVTAASEPIGRQTAAGDVTGEDRTTAEVDDVTKYATTAESLTSEMRASQNNEASAHGNDVNLCGLDTVKADRMNELPNDLQTPLKSSTYDREPSVECLALECRVPPSSRSLDELSMGYDENSSSGHPSQSGPRSMSARPDDVFITQSLDRDGQLRGHPSEGEPRSASAQPHSLGPDVKRGHPVQNQPRSMTAQPDDVFSDEIITTPTRSLGRGEKLGHPFRTEPRSMSSQPDDGKPVSAAPRRLLPSPLMFSQSRCHFENLYSPQ